MLFTAHSDRKPCSWGGGLLWFWETYALISTQPNGRKKKHAKHPVVKSHGCTPQSEACRLLSSTCFPIFAGQKSHLRREIHVCCPWNPTWNFAGDVSFRTLPRSTETMRSRAQVIRRCLAFLGPMWCGSNGYHPFIDYGYPLTSWWIPKKVGKTACHFSTIPQKHHFLFGGIEASPSHGWFMALFYPH